MEKKALKNVPRLYLYHQMLMLNLKILNINQKGDFRPLRPSLIKKNHKKYYTIRRMDVIKYSYDGKFEGNILIVGTTGCRKTTFVQNFEKKKLFGNIKEVYWVPKIEPI